MKLMLMLVVLLMLAGVSFGYAESTEQTTCPVMEGTPVDRTLYTEYQGKRVYFCCKMCKSTFASDPSKYVAKLPQFSSKIDSGIASHDAHSHNGVPRSTESVSGVGLNLYSFIKPMGIATYSCLLVTILMGLFRKRLRPRFLILHKSFAFSTFALATTHAVLILILH